MSANDVKIVITVSDRFLRYVRARYWNNYLSAVNPLCPCGETPYSWDADKTAMFTCLQAAVYETYEDIYRKLGIRPGNGDGPCCRDLASIISWGDKSVKEIEGIMPLEDDEK